jgi:hypothetical protein
MSTSTRLLGEGDLDLDTGLELDRSLFDMKGRQAEDQRISGKR